MAGWDEGNVYYTDLGDGDVVYDARGFVVAGLLLLAGCRPMDPLR